VVKVSPLMKIQSSFWKFVSLALALILTVAIARIFLFLPITMSSLSMEPTIDLGNTVICTKCFNNSALRKGDLVVVTINYDQSSFTTIRRFIEYRDGGKSAWLIAEGSGFRALPDGSTVSKKYFDSHKVGSVPLADIKLKVLFVLPTHIKAKSDRALQMH
jgi:signal peptidase I